MKNTPFRNPPHTRYDFFAEGKPPVSIVVAIVEDQVYAVYRICGFEDVGTGDEWMSGNLRSFEHAGGGFRRGHRRVYKAEVIKSMVVGKPIRGWTAPRHPIARFGEDLFNSVEI